jgi:hypothetical protein
MGKVLTRFRKVYKVDTGRKVKVFTSYNAAARLADKHPNAAIFEKVAGHWDRIA